MNDPDELMKLLENKWKEICAAMNELQKFSDNLDELEKSHWSKEDIKKLENFHTMHQKAEGEA